MAAIGTVWVIERFENVEKQQGGAGKNKEIILKCLAVVVPKFTEAAGKQQGPRKVFSGTPAR